MGDRKVELFDNSVYEPTVYVPSGSVVVTPPGDDVPTDPVGNVILAVTSEDILVELNEVGGS